MVGANGEPFPRSSATFFEGTRPVNQNNFLRLGNISAKNRYGEIPKRPG
jgi:hypothetical protein